MYWPQSVSIKVFDDPEEPCIYDLSSCSAGISRSISRRTEGKAGPWVVSEIRVTLESGQELSNRRNSLSMVEMLQAPCLNFR